MDYKDTELLEKIECFFDEMDEMTKIRSNISKESDRGCILLSVSYLDNQLKKVIKNKLVNNKKIIEEIIETGKPLGTFSSRIDMAYLIGIISLEQRRQLHIIRKIRNECGHSYEDLSFDTSSIKDRVLELDCNQFVYDDIRSKFIKEVMSQMVYLSDFGNEEKRILEKEDKRIQYKLLEQFGEKEKKIFINVYRDSYSRVNKDDTTLHNKLNYIMSDEFENEMLDAFDEKMRLIKTNQ